MSMTEIDTIILKEPQFDGMFWEVEVELMPTVSENPFLHLKHRQQLNESDLHISLPEDLQKQGLAGKIIKLAVEELSDCFGLLVIAEARITNPHLLVVINRLIAKNELDIIYNTEFNRWEFSSRK